MGNPDRRILENALLRQIESLAKYQDEGGMWHTLIDDPTSYLEASATSGFGFGILKAVEQGIVPESYRANAMRALQPVLDCIDEKRALCSRCPTAPRWAARARTSTSRSPCTRCPTARPWQFCS